MVNNKDLKHHTVPPLPSVVWKDGTEADINLGPISRYFEKQFRFSPIYYLRNTPRGLVGNRAGTPVKIGCSSPTYRCIEKSLKSTRGKVFERQELSHFFQVLCGEEWAGCIAVDKNGSRAQSGGPSQQILLLYLSKILGILLENQRLWKMLERSERQSSLGFLSAGVFHEIRNPLTALSTLLQLLPQKKNNSDFMNSFQALMLKELDRLVFLTDQSLKFALVRGEKPAEVDLEETLERIHQLIRPSLGRKKIQIKIRIEPGLKLRMEQVQFESLAVNLLKNALAALGEKGAIEITAKRFARGKERKNDGICLMVKDDGKGIDSKEIEKIFDPFFTTKSGGTGLGLYICRRVVENYGGVLKAKSKKGQGTVFSACFPSGNSWEKQEDL